MGIPAAILPKIGSRLIFSSLEVSSKKIFGDTFKTSAIFRIFLYLG